MLRKVEVVMVDVNHYKCSLGLVKKGFQAYRVDEGVLTEVVNKLGSSIPILKKSQTNQNSQELLDNNQEHN